MIEYNAGWLTRFMSMMDKGWRQWPPRSPTRLSRDGALITSALVVPQFVSSASPLRPPAQPPAATGPAPKLVATADTITVNSVLQEVRRDRHGSAP